MKGKVFRGQPLFYLLKGLPNNGVGRLIRRGSVSQLQDKPSYMRIVEVNMKPVVTKKKRKKKHMNVPQIEVHVRKTSLGLTLPKITNLRTTSHLADFLLIPKEEEHKYVENSVERTPTKSRFYFTKSQRDQIDKLVSEGKALVEARRIVIEKEKLQAAGAGEANLDYIDEDEDDDNEEDGNDSGEEDLEEDDAKVKNNAPRCDDKKRANAESTGHRTQRGNIEDKELFIEVVEEELGDFTEHEWCRINKMISDGVHPDTAKQLEWERKLAFERNAQQAKEKFSKRKRTSGGGANHAKLARKN